MASSGTESGSAQPEGEAPVKQPQYRSDVGKLTVRNSEPRKKGQVVWVQVDSQWVKCVVTNLKIGPDQQLVYQLKQSGKDGKAITNKGDQWFPQARLWDWEAIKDSQDVVQHEEAGQ